jgi:hypothetical protein
MEDIVLSCDWVGTNYARFLKRQPVKIIHVLTLILMIFVQIQMTAELENSKKGDPLGVA